MNKMTCTKTDAEEAFNKMVCTKEKKRGKKRGEDGVHKSGQLKKQ